MVTDNYDWVFDNVKKIKNIKPMGFILKKSKKGKYLESYRLKIIKTEYFRDKIQKRFNIVEDKIKKKETKIKKFHQEITDEENVVFVLDVEDHSSIKKTIDEIYQTSSANESDKLETLDKAKFSAMLFDLPEEESIIGLDFVSIYDKKAFKKMGLIATYDENGLEELEKDAVLVFKFTLPCIYFEKKSKLIIFDKKKTETMFNLMEYYQEKARKTFTKLKDEDIIEISNNVFESEIKNVENARKINKMIEDDSFIMDVDRYKKYDKFLKNDPDIDDELTRLEIKNNKVIIDNKDKFRSFLHMTENNLQRSVLDDDDDTYISFRKRKVKRKSDKK